MTAHAADRKTRIHPVPAENRAGYTLELLDTARRGREQVANIYATFVANPVLFERWLSLAHGLLFEGSLSGRDRELLVLRTAVNCDCEYEWAQHQKFAMAGGISQAEIAAIYGDWRQSAWSEKDHALLSAADELHTSSAIADPTWSVLAGHFDSGRLIELTMVVGLYHLVAMMLNSFGVQLDEGLPEFPRQ